MSQEQFRLIFDGRVLADGLMDVRELAPALLAAGELFQATNQFVNGDRAHVSLQVKSEIKQGSFDLGLVLDQTLIDQAKQFLQIHPHVKEAKEILEILFFYGSIVTTAGTSLLHFLKWLRGRSVQSGTVQFVNNGVVVFKIGEDSIELSETVLKLAQEKLIRQHIEALVAPLKRAGIEELRMESGNDKIHVLKDEVQYLASTPANYETVLDNEREAVFEIVRLSFEREHKWGLSDGTTRIRATINDDVFWNEVDAGLRFAQGDHISVLLRTKTEKTDSGDLKSDYFVERVLSHMPRTQLHQGTIEEPESQGSPPIKPIRAITLDDELI